MVSIFGDNQLGKPVSWIGHDYISSKLNKFKELGVINDAQRDDVMAKVNISMAYSTEMQNHAKTLRNHEKLEAVISKEQQSRLAEIHRRIKALATSQFAEIASKIGIVALSKKKGVDQLHAALKDLFEKHLVVLKDKSAKSFKAWVEFEKIERPYTEKFLDPDTSEEKRKAESFELFKKFTKELDKYIESVKSKSECKKVKNELNSGSEDFGRAFALLHEELNDFPSQILRILNAEEAVIKPKGHKKK